MNIAVKRILKDIKTLNDNPLDNIGIYIHTTDDLYNLQVMMIGPENTPYNYGYFFFDVFFPENYPYSPPNIKYCTQGLNIRFNPNLYINGKVCLSLLNTWHGPQWTSCNSLLSILLSIHSTIFIKHPLTNEPGFETASNSIQSNNYNKIVEFGTYNVSIIKMIEYTPIKFKYFKSIMISELHKNYSKILDNINLNIKKYKTNTLIKCNTYSMNIILNYLNTLSSFNLLIEDNKE